MQIDTVVYFQITDRSCFAYGIESPMAAIENLTATTLRNIIGDLELDPDAKPAAISSTPNERSILDEATDAWGIKGKPRGAERTSFRRLPFRNLWRSR